MKSVENSKVREESELSSRRTNVASQREAPIPSSGIVAHPDGVQEPGSATKPGAVSLTCVALVLAYLWFVLIRHLSVEWSINEQYTYGWAVPVLCAYLFWKRFTASHSDPIDVSHSPPSRSLFAIAVILFLYLPTRLVQEANPEWRAVSWALGLEIVGFTILVARYIFQSKASHFSFSILFFLIAIPWPTFLETPVIQGLTQANTATTVELLGWTGTPALQRGNVIEISTGVVGIDEACSGIRSLQASLMIALFVGEFYRLGVGKRLSLVLSAIAFSFLFNVARTWLLVTVAARTSPVVMSKTWHDPAGIAVLLACFGSVWGLAYGWKKNCITADGSSQLPVRAQVRELANRVFDAKPLRNVAPFLAAWILCSEITVEGWYRAHERSGPAQKSWAINWPTNAAAFQQLAMTENEKKLLRFNEAEKASWQDHGLSWQVIALRWNQGRAATRLATGHTPEVCLTAAGRKPSAISPVHSFKVRNLEMPFRRYDLENEETPLHVFYCLWNEKDNRRFVDSASMTYRSRLLPVLRGERNTGQKSIEIAIWGSPTGPEAETALARELPKIIAVKE